MLLPPGSKKNSREQLPPDNHSGYFKQMLFLLFCYLMLLTGIAMAKTVSTTTFQGATVNAPTVNVCKGGATPTSIPAIVLTETNKSDFKAGTVAGNLRLILDGTGFTLGGSPMLFP